jgi:pimeloyl-ACP methyl ester carboxylesterase
VAEALPNASCVVIDDCGHVPQFEHPELTARLTREFIDALPGHTSRATAS